jgi:hypothetical protein
VSLLVPLRGSMQNETCAQIKAQEALVIAQRTARRYTLEPSSYYPYAAAAHRFTGARVFIHVAGRRVTGSSGRGPAHLPAHGTVVLRRITFRVESFHAPSTQGRATVYVLVAE